jgi:hypothetical protein
LLPTPADPTTPSAVMSPWRATRRGARTGNRRQRPLRHYQRELQHCGRQQRRL